MVTESKIQKLQLHFLPLKSLLKSEMEWIQVANIHMLKLAAPILCPIC